MGISAPSATTPVGQETTSMWEAHMTRNKAVDMITVSASFALDLTSLYGLQRALEKIKTTEKLMRCHGSVISMSTDQLEMAECLESAEASA